MNPDKLFDYLDGKLPPAERAELETRLASDSFLQRELAVARQIHLGMRDSRETFETLDQALAPTRGAILGRRIAIAFAVLVFFNVIFGLYAIVFMEKKRRGVPPNEQNRREIVRALENTAASALPTPTLDVDEIKVSTPTGQRNAVANKIIAAAAQCGGSAAKNLSDENGVLLFAELPAARENEFREKLTSLGAAPSKTSAASPANGNRIIQIRVVPEANR
jgi:anti-sigma factor RsiW